MRNRLLVVIDCQTQEAAESLALLLHETTTDDGPHEFKGFKLMECPFDEAGWALTLRQRDLVKIQSERRRVEREPETVHFNTGRLYSKHGQRISATRYGDGRVTFYDHDRMVDGEFRSAWRPSEPLRQEVMIRYDQMDYKSSQKSREDGLYAGGPNAKYEEPTNPANGETDPDGDAVGRMMGRNE